MKFFALILILFICFESHSEEIIPVCQRSTLVREALETLLGKTCASISAQDLRPIRQFFIQNGDNLNLKASDLAGLSNIRYLVMANIAKLQIQPYAFTQTPSLTSLVIGNTSLPTIEANMFWGLNQLELLHISNAKVKTIIPDGLNGLDSLFHLALTECHLTKIDKETFKRLPKLRIVDLQNCKKLVEIQDDSFVDLLYINTIRVQNAPLTSTRKGAFNGVLSVSGLPPTFDTDTTDSDWIQP